LKFLRLLVILLIVSSCKKESASITFSEVNILKESKTTIEINMPKAIGKPKAVNNINATLNDFVFQVLHVDASEEKKETIEESILAFNQAFANFNSLINSELRGQLPNWEALIDGEVIYTNENIACVVMNSSINTGAANSSMILRFYNFSPKTGAILNTSDLVNHVEDFTLLVKRYYEKEINSSFNEATTLLSENVFKLPENLGFSDEGVILFYDNFNIGGFEKEIVEFTIPYEVANDYLKI